MWLYNWMRWESQLMVLCAAAFALALVYAQFDEDFSDLLLWNSRSYHYPNGISVACLSGRSCENVNWDVKNAQDLSQNALSIDMSGGRVTAQDLADPAGLQARGWIVAGSDPESGSLYLQTPGSETSIDPYVQVSLQRGRLVWVNVRPNAGRYTMTVQGRPVHLPLSRHKVAQVWGPFVTLSRRNAVNGTIVE